MAETEKGFVFFKGIRMGGEDGKGIIGIERRFVLFKGFANDNAEWIKNI